MHLGLVQSQHNAMYDFLNPRYVGSVQQARMRQRAQVEHNLELLRGAEGKDCDLLVTTECIDYIRTAACNRPQDRELYPTLDCGWVHSLGAAARAARSWLVAGFGYRKGARAFNAALVFDRAGRLQHMYHKIHLAGDEGQVFTPGEDFCVFPTEFGRVGVCVCWDMQFPETARQLALRGADLIVCPTWGWEADLYGRTRAYENGVFTAAAMAVPAWGPVQSPRTPSSAVAPDGTMLCCASPEHPELLCCDLSLERAAKARNNRLSGRRPELYHENSK